MELISSSFTFQRVAKVAKFHLGRLETHKKTKELHEEFFPQATSFVGHFSQWREARERLSILLGALAFADADFDDALADLSAAVLIAVGRDRTSTVYRTFYPEGRIQETTEAPLDHTQRTIDRMVEAHASYPDAASQELIDRVKTTGAEVLDAMKAVQQQEIVIAKHRANMEITRIPLARAYNDNVSRLRLIFPGKRRLVESFYVQRNVEDKDET